MQDSCLVGRVAAVVTFAISVVCSPQAIAGPLTGQTVGATNSTGAILPAATAAVGPGVEFTSFKFGTLDFFSADLTENGEITIALILTGSLNHGAGQLISFFDVFSAIPDVVGATLVSTSGVSGITQSDINFTPNTVTMELGLGTFWTSTGANFVVRLNFAPEPGSLALLAIAVAGLAGLRLRRTG